MATFRGILVAVDGSPNSEKAAETAISLAKMDRASLYILSVIPRQAYVDAPSIEATKKDSETLVQGLVTEARSQGIEVRGEIEENASSIIGSITDYAKEWKVDLIVVGTRGFSGFKRLLLGSVSSGILPNAPCTVLVVR